MFLELHSYSDGTPVYVRPDAIVMLQAFRPPDNDMVGAAIVLPIPIPVPAPDGKTTIAAAKMVVRENVPQIRSMIAESGEQKPS